jgi:hypothetical protein
MTHHEIEGGRQVVQRGGIRTELLPEADERGPAVLIACTGDESALSLSRIGDIR